MMGAGAGAGVGSGSGSGSSKLPQVNGHLNARLAVSGVQAHLTLQAVSLNSGRQLQCGVLWCATMCQYV